MQLLVQEAVVSKTKTMTLAWAQSAKGLPAARDAAIRALLDLPALPKAPPADENSDSNMKCSASGGEDEEDDFQVDAEDDETPAEIAEREGYTVKEVLVANRHIKGLRANSKLIEGTWIWLPRRSWDKPEKKNAKSSSATAHHQAAAASVKCESDGTRGCKVKKETNEMPAMIKQEPNPTAAPVKQEPNPTAAPVKQEPNPTAAPAKQEPNPTAAVPSSRNSGRERLLPNEQPGERATRLLAGIAESMISSSGDEQYSEPGPRSQGGFFPTPTDGSAAAAAVSREVGYTPGGACKRSRPVSQRPVAPSPPADAPPKASFASTPAQVCNHFHAQSTPKAAEARKSLAFWSGGKRQRSGASVEDEDRAARSKSARTCNKLGGPVVIDLSLD